MRRLLWLGMLLLAGCQGITGPFAHRPPQRVDDPRLTIDEQKARARDRLALPEDSRLTVPSYIDNYGPFGR